MKLVSALQGWDFESIDTADSSGDSNKFELEPMNEMVIGHNVHLSSVVKSSTPDSFLCFAQVRGRKGQRSLIKTMIWTLISIKNLSLCYVVLQDSSGAIWKLDLSFTYTVSFLYCHFGFYFGDVMSMLHMIFLLKMDDYGATGNTSVFL